MSKSCSHSLSRHYVPENFLLISAGHRLVVLLMNASSLIKPPATFFETSSSCHAMLSDYDFKMNFLIRPFYA